MGRFKGVHHPAFATADMDRTVSFWRDLLGLRLVYTTGEPGDRQYFFEVAQGSYIAFFEWDEVAAPRPKRPGRSVAGPFLFDHLCLTAEDEEHLWELSDRLFTADYPISDVVDHGFVHSIYTYDPNNLPLELASPVPGVALGRPARFRDRPPSASAEEGAAPVPGRWPEPEPLPVEERIVIPGGGRGDFENGNG